MINLFVQCFLSGSKSLIEGITSLHGITHLGRLIVLYKRARHCLDGFNAGVDSLDDSLVGSRIDRADIGAHRVLVSRSSSEASKVGIAHAFDVVDKVLNGVIGRKLTLSSL